MANAGMIRFAGVVGTLCRVTGIRLMKNHVLEKGCCCSKGRMLWSGVFLFFRFQNWFHGVITNNILLVLTLIFSSNKKLPSLLI